MENSVHPTAVIEGSVRLGKNNWIGPYAVILGEVEIGDDNWIGPHVVIGAPPEHCEDLIQSCMNITRIIKKPTLTSLPGRQSALNRRGSTLI